MFFLIHLILEARAEIQKYFRWFLVQMKSWEFAFEINWPLGCVKNFVKLSIELWINKINFVKYVVYFCYLLFLKDSSHVFFILGKPCNLNDVIFDKMVLPMCIWKKHGSALSQRIQSWSWREFEAYMKSSHHAQPS